MAMMVADSVFVDTNVLVYATLMPSPFHQAAQKAITSLKGSGAELWISRQVLREYLATLTRPQTFLAFGSSIAVSTLIAEAKHLQTNYKVAEDDRVVTEGLLNLIATYPIGGKQVHDANIVATMLTYGIRKLLTHNVSDFARFSPLITVTSL
jgi:predicted nucleic acid-binding protein